MKEFIEYVTKQLVDHPEDVSIQEETIDDQIIYRIKVAQPDIGKVIGKKGRTVLSFRTLVSAISKKIGKKVRVELVEDRLKEKH